MCRSPLLFIYLFIWGYLFSEKVCWLIIPALEDLFVFFLPPQKDGGGPQRYQSNSPMKKVWASWACLAWKRFQGDTAVAFQYLEGAYNRKGSNLLHVLIVTG